MNFMCFQVLSTFSSGWSQAKRPQFCMLLNNHLKMKALLKEQSRFLSVPSQSDSKNVVVNRGLSHLPFLQVILC